jgi:uridine kinase
MLLIGVAGGTGCGKTTVVEKIVDGLESDKYSVLILHEDSYYRDLSHLPMEERKKFNYDHPLAFDNELLIAHLKDLAEGKTVPLPVYSYSTYTRTGEITLNPKEIIILEGILVLEEKALREMMDIKLYVDTDADVRFIRRLQRDVLERKRDSQQVIDQYLNVVRPMHLQFVEPTKRYADIIIPEGGHNKVAIDVLIAKIKSIVKK